MFDTNIFREVLDGKIPTSKFPQGFSYYVTHIQRNELEETRDNELLKKLLKIFTEMDKMLIPTEGAVVGVSEVDEAKIGNNELYHKILQYAQECDKRKRKQKSQENQIRDALIAETSIKNNLMLVTNDNCLLQAIQKFGGKAITLSDFFGGNFTVV